MQKFKVAKLVRDKIAQRMIADENASYKVLNDEEYITELKKKVLEEAKELVLRRNKSNILKELADIQEIIDLIIKALKSSKKELKIKQKRKKKGKNWGGFKKRLYVKSIELGDDHPWLDYYLKNPEKYPKIKK